MTDRTSCSRGAWAWCLVGLLAVAVRADLVSYNSRSYVIQSDLPADEVRLYAAHMDKVFAEYQARFSSFRSKRSGPMPLFLFRTQQGYMTYLASHNIDATNSGGMFFVRANGQGLATFVEGSTREASYSVLQHEGFHQFAYNYIGGDLPIWANEGLAQYFEDGIIVKNAMKLGIANKQRIDRVRHALETGKAIDFDRLLAISGEEWSATLARDPAKAVLLYAQSWSVVYFLVHGDNGKYRQAFERYLKLVGSGRESTRAFPEAFGSSDTAPFRRRWEQFALKQEPDDLTTALSRLEFLSAGLKFLHARNEPAPQNLAELKDRLQRIGFRLTRTSHGMSEDISAADDTNFVYPRGKAEPVPFLLLAPARNDLPPRLQAPGLKPEPTLVWQRQGDELTSHIEFR